MDEEERIAAARAAYAAQRAADAGWDDPRLEAAFAGVRREDFCGASPWRILDGGFGIARCDDPAALYDDVLVALDPARGINNGQPALHAAWMGAVRPQPGEAVCHVGAGSGYYTAILHELVRPGGAVLAYEIEADLAAAAKRNLAGREGVRVVEGDAGTADLPACDILYVNAGLAAPPVVWLDALKPGGRLVFPWRPSSRIGLAVLVTRMAAGFAAQALMGSWFIPCAGAWAATEAIRSPSPQEAESVASLWRRADTEPDASAVAVYDAVWFSDRALEAPQSTS